MARDTHNEDQYLALLERAHAHGVYRDDRTGTGTYSLFAPQLRVDLERGFPLLTTKEVNWTACWAELRWMLAGQTNVKQLAAKIWDPWADEYGELGPVYGAQWRRYIGLGDDPEEPGFGGELVRVDQLAEAEHRLRTNPDDRRIIVSAWNVAQLDKMRLPPCHLLFQFWTYTRPARRRSTHRHDVERVLCTHVYQRSADLFIGVPFNVASYAALTHIMAERVGMQAGEVVFSFGDAHVYANHDEQVRRQLSREPVPAPWLWIDGDALRALHDLSGLQSGSNKYVLGIRDYAPHPAIRADVAV